MIVFKCLKCGEQLEAPPSLGGQVVTCPACGNVSEVPSHAHGPVSRARPAPRCTRLVYILLALFLGALGVHNFVAGYAGRGAAQLLITILLGWLILPLIAVVIWVIIEIVATTRDVNGVRMN